MQHSLQETHFSFRRTYRLKVKGQRKIFHAGGNQKRTEITVLDQTKQTNSKAVTRNKEGHSIRGSIHQDNITKTNSKWIEDLRTKATKLLEENRGNSP